MTASHVRLRLRIAGIVLAAALMVWLPFEDTDTRSVLLMALAAAALMGANLLHAVRGRSLLSFIGAGLLSGLSVSPIAAGFMLIKIGLHGHGGVPDFTIEDFTQIFNRTLFLGAAGLCIGAGLKLYFFSD